MSIKELRKRAGLSQLQLAGQVGLSQSDISRIERGQRSMTVPQLILFAQALGVAPERLLELSIDKAA